MLFEIKTPSEVRPKKIVLHLELSTTPNSIGSWLIQKKEESGGCSIASIGRKILQEAKSLDDKKRLKGTMFSK